MKKTNFLKAFAMAAVVLFAASCSEESLSIAGGNIVENPTVLPEPTASVSVTVVDLEAGKIIGDIKTENATEYIGKVMPVECPANPGYTTAAAVNVAIPSLSKGQSINIPVTFYVTTLGSALEEFLADATTEIEAIEGEDAVTESVVSTSDAAKKAINKEAGWTLNEDGTISYVNETENNLVAYHDAPLFFVDAKSGYEFVEEVVESKAAETSLLDLIKTKKFDVYETVNSWDIAKLSTFTIKKISQKFYLAKIKLENKELGQSVEFIANVAGALEFKTEATKIEIDHNLGHEDINNGHEDVNVGHGGNNSHNGHGHGGSSNAGGGIGGNEGE